MIAFGISAYVQFATYRVINPSLAGGSLVVALALGFGGISLVILPPALMKLLGRDTGQEDDGSVSDEITGLPEAATPSVVASTPLGRDARTVSPRMGDPSPVPEWIQTTPLMVDEQQILNEQIKAPPQLSLEELTRRLKGLEIRVGKLRKRLLRAKPVVSEELVDSIAVENDVRACLLEALELQHTKGEISDDFYRRKYEQLKLAED